MENQKIPKVLFRYNPAGTGRSQQKRDTKNIFLKFNQYLAIIFCGTVAVSRYSKFGAGTGSKTT
jgi:hypothetical protein